MTETEKNRLQSWFFDISELGNRLPVFGSKNRTRPDLWTLEVNEGPAISLIMAASWSMWKVEARSISMFHWASELVFITFEKQCVSSRSLREFESIRVNWEHCWHSTSFSFILFGLRAMPMLNVGIVGSDERTGSQCIQPFFDDESSFLCVSRHLSVDNASRISDESRSHGFLPFHHARL